MNMQTTNRHSVEFLTEVKRRPAIADMLEQAKVTLRGNSDACVTIGNNSMVQVRIGEGKRTWVSMRALMWMDRNYLHSTGYPQPPLFTAPTCGTAGCINPRHQQERAENQQRVKVSHAQ